MWELSPAGFWQELPEFSPTNMWWGREGAERPPWRGFHRTSLRVSFWLTWNCSHTLCNSAYVCHTGCECTCVAQKNDFCAKTWRCIMIFQRNIMTHEVKECCADKKRLMLPYYLHSLLHNMKFCFKENCEWDACLLTTTLDWILIESTVMLRCRNHLFPKTNYISEGMSLCERHSAKRQTKEPEEWYETDLLSSI